ncbi:hypothetical protein M6B38_198230 [Iris pallida]|uniref:Uncharacterized protein n=1 Tax=Iris pallida TaxID=29817 RepID=A0AAX6EBQ5_IRIPA|nr:hypothetical protein M6B38_198230 [Iris pallida]
MRPQNPNHRLATGWDLGTVGRNRSSSSMKTRSARMAKSGDLAVHQSYEIEPHRLGKQQSVSV